jgi:4-deoxy-L-threo-5-hexosulose-uronate ketol-isomerase
MEIRDAIHPDHAAELDTDGLRSEFLIQGLFVPGEIRMVYSHADRIIVGGACPAQPLELKGGRRITGTDHLLERREMGIVNIGHPGKVVVGGTEYRLGRFDGLYIGMGVGPLLFASERDSEPARFYFNCATAHHSYPPSPIPAHSIEPQRLGSAEQANRREIFKYIHPGGVKSCQLVMGLTRLEPGSVWNTMPAHTHQRRMEVYLYFGLPQDAVVFHLMGQPGETRHIVVRNEEAVISPSWSIHCGVGTRSYAFIWGMVGENQAFEDMDAVPMSTVL